MAAQGTALFALLALAWAAASVAALDPTAEGSCGPPASKDSKDHVLLQVQAKSRGSLREAACTVGDWVRCPGGGSCAGNQCCPNGEVCPSAQLYWSDCAKPKSVDCLPSYQQPCKVGALVGCPGSHHTCAGNQCCPGVNGTGSTVCPSAEYGWDDCDLPKAFECVQPKCEVGAKVLCAPDSNPHAFCAGNECCGNANGSFVCPSADRDWNQCDGPKAFDCLEPEGEPCEEGDLVYCPGSHQHCYGNQCCPSVNGSGSSVCPSAEPGWDFCDRPKQLDCLPH
mmetsp:Transcript_68286/g.158486  ORF Transcript_68286/g.158486 Transcript_68286/m.158486 type:complete len:281 (+) Transcript_68286:47-889(+)